MRKRLPPAVACRYHAHQAGIEPVLHEAHQNTVLDQRGAVGRRSLIIDADRATPVGDRTIIDDGDTLGGNALAHQPREGRSFLAVEIAFQPVADGFMQQNAGPARPQQHIHLTGGCGLCFERNQTLAQCLAGGVLPSVFSEIGQRIAAPAKSVAALALLFAIRRNHRNLEAHQRANVTVGAAVGANDFDRLPVGGQRHRYLLDPRVETTGIAVGFLQEVDLLGETQRRGRIAVDIEFGIAAGGRNGRCSTLAATRCGETNRGSPFEGLLGKFRRMRIGGCFTADCSQPKSLGLIEASGFQLAIVIDQTFALPAFKEKFAVVSLVQGLGHDGYSPVAAQAGIIEEGDFRVRWHGGRSFQGLGTPKIGDVARFCQCRCGIRVCRVRPGRRKSHQGSFSSAGRGQALHR